MMSTAAFRQVAARTEQLKVGNIIRATSRNSQLMIDVHAHCDGATQLAGASRKDQAHVRRMRFFSPIINSVAAFFGQAEFAVNAGKDRLSGLCRFLGIIEKTPPHTFPIFPNAAFPHFPLDIPADADKTRSVIPLTRFIGAILRGISRSQIFNPIVRPDAVPMVQERSPLTIKMQPREHMSVIISRFWKLNLKIALHLRSGDLARISRIPLARIIVSSFPSKQSRDGIVIEPRSHGLNTHRYSARFCHESIFRWLLPVSIPQQPHVYNS
jgi:hypothetical protein